MPRPMAAVCDESVLTGLREIGGMRKAVKTPVGFP